MSEQKEFGVAEQERGNEDDFYTRCGYETREKWNYDHDLLCDKVDMMNRKLNEGMTLPIGFIMDQENIPLHKRIKLLNDMINSLAVELAEAVANGKFPELKKFIKT